MNTQIVEVRKNITLLVGLNAANSWTQTINTVSFTPDEVIVRQITYVSTINEQFTTGIYSDMVQDIIGSFSDSRSVSPNITFTLKKPITGQYNFNLVFVPNDPAAIATRTGSLIIHLEFIKYIS